jgi:glycosyltransferase involved in cell wall biosynthesis
MNILVFSHFFPPEIGAAPMRIADHASRWVRKGHNVTVITNIPNSPFGKFYEGYKNGLFFCEIYQGIKVKRILTFPSGKKKNKFHRGGSFVVNTLGSILAGIIESKPDIVFATAPYLSGIPGLICSLWHDVPLIYELRDPWVQVATATRTVKKKSMSHNILKSLEKKIVGHAKELVVIGREMADFLQNEMALSKRPFVVHNAVDTEKKTSSVRKKFNLPAAQGKFVIGSIGNMGNQYDFEVILDAAFELSESPFYFFFLGEGKQLRRIKQKTKDLGLKNVGFYPPVPSSEVDNWFDICDVTVVSMKKEPIFEVYLPLKTLGSMDAEVPVLFGGHGETERILEESGAGSCFAPGDSEALVKLLRYYSENENIIQREGTSGKRFIQNKFNRSVMACKYINLFDKVISENF